jgi:D-alanyl-D-alanine carboxypeptidase
MNSHLVKKELGHNKTIFQNPHGMLEKENVSTAWELAEACLRFMKN